MLLLAVFAGGALWLRGRLGAGLPRLSGEVAVSGLSAAVTVERDALGVPTIRARNRLDAARALGFLHAQDRFFQMDLLRRQSAGELAELFGPNLLGADRRRRVHRFRHVAELAWERASAGGRDLLEAYAAGVNAGLRSLAGKPFEYVLLRAEPAPWRPQDSLLATYSMFLTLSDATGSVEAALGRLHERLPPALFAFLAPRGTEWDAPLIGPAFATPPIPGPEVFDLRTARAQPAPGPAPGPAQGKIGRLAGTAASPAPAGSVAAAPWPFGDGEAAGSNNWAVSGAHAAGGHALLANDMHLGIGVPNTWYRVSMVWGTAGPGGLGGPGGSAGNADAEAGVEQRITGVTLPGTPAVVVGSNGHVAWGFTNSYGDYTDLIDLECDPRDPEVYRTPAGPRRFERHVERIRVLGHGDDSFTVRWTVWGPVVAVDDHGRPRALAWTAHDPEAANLGITGLENARTVAAAIAAANAAGIPPQNFTVVDAAGSIGWTIIGKVPRRVGFDGRLPSSWADGTHRWDGWLAPEEVPKIVDPPAGRIWTANARVVGGEMLARLGDGGYSLGARARQIRDRLLALERATAADMLALQLDDRALFLERWRGLLLRTLSPRAVAADRRRAELRRVVERTWSGRAAISSAAYRVVHDYRELLLGRVYASFAGEGTPSESAFYSPNRQFEGPLWRLLSERPAHLLDPRYRSWDEALFSAADALLARYAQQGGRLAHRTWGERNTTHFQHPLSLAVPLLGRFLDMPSHALPGDENMPRVQGPRHGASERLVVSPGHEEEGYFEMPDGESGHPMSPHYADSHAAWEAGAPTPFLPGPAVDLLRLVPAPAAPR